jgi:hypothetical protein
MKISIEGNALEIAILSLVNVGQKITILQLIKISICLEEFKLSRWFKFKLQDK